MFTDLQQDGSSLRIVAILRRPTGGLPRAVEGYHIVGYLQDRQGNVLFTVRRKVRSLMQKVPCCPKDKSSSFKPPRTRRVCGPCFKVGGMCLARGRRCVAGSKSLRKWGCNGSGGVDRTSCRAAVVTSPACMKGAAIGLCRGSAAAVRAVTSCLPGPASTGVWSEKFELWAARDATDHPKVQVSISGVSESGGWAAWVRNPLKVLSKGGWSTVRRHPEALLTVEKKAGTEALTIDEEQVSRNAPVC